MNKVTAEVKDEALFLPTEAFEKLGWREDAKFFFKFIVDTPLEDQDDFLHWAMCYRKYLQIFQYFHP